MTDTATQKHRIINRGRIRLYDTVIVCNPDYEEGNPKNLPDGTRLRCVGHLPFLHAEDFGRSYSSDTERGLYLRYGEALFSLADPDPAVRTIGGERTDAIFEYSAHSLVFEVEPEREKEPHHWEVMVGRGMKVSDLPETLFYLKDQVLFTDYSLGGRGSIRPTDSRFSHGIVSSIHYPHETGKGVQYTVGLMYNVDGKLVRSGTYCFVDTECLSLLKGGLIRTYLTDPDNLSFESIPEMTEFLYLIGEGREERNPETGDYGWTIESALQFIRGGHGAAIKMFPGLMGLGPSISVFSFPKYPEAEAKIRTAVLEGFAEDLAKLD